MFAITGSTGEVGRKVAERLAKLGMEQRLIVRDPDRAPKLPCAAIFQASSYSDARAMGRALEGVETLFLVSARDRMGIIHESAERRLPVPPYDRLQEHVAAVAAAAAVGARRIVYLSFLAATEDATFILARDHFHTEEYLRSVGVAFTFLRPSLYMDKVAQHISRSDVIRAPAGNGRVAWVARDDVADVAVAVLIGSGHEGRTYDVTGPEALTMAETAEKLSAACGRRITYEAQSPHEVRTFRNTSRLDAMEARRIALTGRGITDYEVEVWISHYLQIATGETDVVSETVQALCGRPATTLADYLAREAKTKGGVL
ncbi:MAG TPA: NAD(P)H-binding protein [Syntrophorhabdales bacterium]|nr:NAD(P)H-binding protein [Syntrophorhabdales bacterium]